MPAFGERPRVFVSGTLFSVGITPPKLEVTVGPQPVGRIRFEQRPAVLREAAGTLPILAFARAVDASKRNDEAFFLGDLEPVRALAHALVRSLRAAEHVGDLVRCFETGDPIDLSVGLDRMSETLAASDDPEAILRSAHLAAHLLVAFVPDDGLDAIVVARVLEFGALEAYYYRGATRAAKAKLEAQHAFIESLTTIRSHMVDADAPLAIGMRVWEAWQAVRSLDRLFGLAHLAKELDDRALGALVRGADVLLHDADPNAALELAVAPDTPAEPRLAPAVRPEPVTGPSVPRPPEDPAAPLPAAARAWWIDPRARPAASGRTVSAIVEDLTSTLERYEILMGGDDDSLLVELAPRLRANVRELYLELSLGHPVVELGLYLDAPVDREQRALRTLLGRGLALDARFEDHRRRLAAGAEDVGYRT